VVLIGCKNCINRANGEKLCIFKHTKILTVEDALLNCNACKNYIPCNGLMKRSWGWDNGKKDVTLVSGKIQCDSCGVVRIKNLKRNDLKDRKRLKCERCGFIHFQ